ncbi:hypothetical protein [Alkalihalobacterium bogoriense]|uniref:hypothetical protein n=1 Tax=Alkalihalobacterium bogoriense TaxID=246272 RepID=UPI00047D1BD8|nr:hypothetical protein [Alkalihalobacterium bogoriense]
MKRLLFFMMLAFFVLNGCSNDESDDYIKIPKDEAPRLWNNADTQLWEYVKDDSLAEETGWTSGVTEWENADFEFAEELAAPNQNWDMPGLLLQAWLHDVEYSEWLGIEVWEITTRINMVSEDMAEGFILSYGLYDDSISGTDIKLSMKRENEYWYIEDVNVRHRCSRGVSEDSQFCN